MQDRDLDARIRPAVGKPEPGSYVIVLKGEEEYRLHFNEADELSDSQRGHVERQFAQFRAWYAEWSKLPGTAIRKAA